MVESIKTMVYSILSDYNSHQQYHYGTIKRINGDGTVDLYIDGSDNVKKNIQCNPDINIRETDKVIVLYVNGNSKDSFVLCKRAK